MAKHSIELVDEINDIFECSKCFKRGKKHEFMFDNCSEEHLPSSTSISTSFNCDHDFSFLLNNLENIS